MSRLPLTVISGYLGAGKTTLINRVLAEDHGLRLLVMVNDFGAINIDEALIASAGDDTISLTNGCVCCTMGADLYLALGDVLKLEQRPDHLLIEASGVADPAAIANAAKAEPQLSYGGIVTLVDGLNAAELLRDPMIAPQVQQQMQVADFLVLTKMPAPSADLMSALDENGLKHPISLDQEAPASPILFGVTPKPGLQPSVPHPAYVRWHHPDPAPMSQVELKEKLSERPAGLYRLKGFLSGPDGLFEVHVVGRHTDIRKASDQSTGLVGLGLAGRITSEELGNWWES